MRFNLPRGAAFGRPCFLPATFPDNGCQQALRAIAAMLSIDYVAQCRKGVKRSL